MGDRALDRPAGEDAALLPALLPWRTLARRELLERLLGRCTVDGNRDCGERRLFLADHARRVAEPNAGDLEEIAVELIDFETLTATLGDGEIALLGVAAALGPAIATRRAER